MKTLILSILLMLSLGFSSQAQGWGQNPWGQTYTPFPTDSMLGWWGEGNAYHCFPVYTTWYRMWTDTVMNGNRYIKVLRSRGATQRYRPAYWFRQDSAQKKAWFRLINQPASEPDTLLFDFSLAHGQMVPPGYLRNPDTMWVTTRVSGWGADVVHQTLTGKRYSVGFVEGIGLFSGIFIDVERTSQMSTGLGQQVVICHYGLYRHGQQITGNCPCPNQAALTATTKPAAAPAISLYPNPVINTLHIDSPHSGLHRVVFYDAQGREVCNTRRTDVMSWDVSQLAPGRYMVQVSSPAGQVVSSFVKE